MSFWEKKLKFLSPLALVLIMTSPLIFPNILSIVVKVKVTPTTFWLKCINLPKCTKSCSTRKLEVADKRFYLLTKKLYHELADTGA